MTGLLIALAGAFGIGAWIAACLTVPLMLNGHRPTVRSYLTMTAYAGLGTMLLAELVAIA